MRHLVPVLLIQRLEMQRVLHEQHDLSDLFISQLLTRNIRVEADLVDQLFNRVDQEPFHQQAQVAR